MRHLEGPMKSRIKLTRRNLLAAAGITGAGALLIGRGAITTARPNTETGTKPMTPDAPIPVAFLLDERATMIDFAGPWEVFQDGGIANVPGFELFTVAPTAGVIRASAGMKIVPEYTLENAPPAKVIIIPAQNGGRIALAGDPKVKWLQERYSSADVIMSVCTGAFLLARTGLLDGLKATTHHLYLNDFAMEFPNVQLQRNQRFVDNGKLITAGGLSSGIEGALHVVERYYGAGASAKIANYMEYVSHIWTEA
jgi:transcriptional regulator GlxA family with amidase domain